LRRVSRSRARHRASIASAVWAFCEKGTSMIQLGEDVERQIA